MRGIYLFFQAEDGIRDLLWSRGLGDVCERQFFKLMVCGLWSVDSLSSMWAVAGQLIKQMVCGLWPGDPLSIWYVDCGR